MPRKQSQIPWTDALYTALVEKVYLMKLHLKAGKPGVTELWNTLNDELFDTNEFIHLRATHYKLGKHRKFKEAYENIVEKVNQEMATGNKSGREGELDRLHEVVQLINNATKPQRR